MQRLHTFVHPSNQGSQRIAAIIAIACAHSALAVDFSIERIIRSGEPMPDGNGAYQSIVFEPVINNHGQVAFSARLTGTTLGAFDNEVLIIGDADTFSIVARERQPAPDGDGLFGTLFEEFQPVFYRPAINDEGTVVSLAGFINYGPGSGPDGIVRGSTDGVEQVVRVGDDTPNGTGVHASVYNSFTPLADSGQTVFFSDVQSIGSFARGVWRGGIETNDLVLQEGDQSPDGDGVISQMLQLRAATGPDDRVSFKAEVQPRSGPLRDALILATSGEVYMLARQGDPAIGGGIWGGMGTGAALATFNDAGQLAIMLGVSVSPLFEWRIYKGDESGLDLVVSEQDPSPDGNGVFEAFSEPQINDAGMTAFLGVFEFVDGYSTDQGAVLATDEGMDVIVRTGDALPEGGVAGLVSTSHLNDAGTLLTPVEIGDTTFDFALLYTELGKSPIEIVRAGDTLDGRMVTSLVLPFASDNGGRTALNESGQVVFAAYFTDGTQGVYVATPITEVPADLDGDGSVGAADLAILLGAWGSCGDPEACPQDLDGNGVINAADLAILLGAWG